MIQSDLLPDKIRFTLNKIQPYINNTPIVKVLLSPGKESSLTHLILEGSAQILHTREVVVEFGQNKTLSLNMSGSPLGKNLVFLANPNAIFPEKNIICREKKN